MTGFAFHSLDLFKGQVALCPMPGREGKYAGDLARIADWGPALVLTMATAAEMRAKGAGALGDDLAARGIIWRHLPVEDYAADSEALRVGWAGVSALAQGLLGSGGRVLVHCMGGCGRSGMAVLRLMVEAGEPADAALARLRAARPCALETDDQITWAASERPRKAP